MIDSLAHFSKESMLTKPKFLDQVRQAVWARHYGLTTNDIPTYRTVARMRVIRWMIYEKTMWRVMQIRYNTPNETGDRIVT